MRHSTQIITFLSGKTALWFNAISPLKLDLDPIFLSRELLFEGTTSKAEHRRNVFMTGAEYFGETAVQPRDYIPVNTMRKSRNHTLSRKLIWLSITTSSMRRHADHFLQVLLKEVSRECSDCRTQVCETNYYLSVTRFWTTCLEG